MQAISGAITIGTLAFLAGSFRQLRSLLEGILSRFTSVSQGAIYLRDFFDFFEIQPRINTPEKPLPFPNPIKQGFVFQNIGFKYHNSDNWANRHLSFTLYAGEKLALVGENGAGKTTLVKLLARLYDPAEGRILLDGVDLRDYDLFELRRNIGIIFQDYLRYQMSFAQNIAVGNIDEVNNRALIEQAAEKSLASLLAQKLPNQYEQALGRRFNNGVELSGGEWQKVALARAYMKEAQLLILDEPTSGLDAESERKIQDALGRLAKGRTTLVIAHRLSTLMHADQIIVLDRGRIVQTGTHDALVSQDGVYRRLWRIQTALEEDLSRDLHAAAAGP